MQNDVSTREVRSLPVETFAAEVAGILAAAIRASLAARGFCRLALAGGETPRAVHTALAATAQDLDWQKVWITFGDERCVPPEDSQSNYHMARESLLERVPILAEHVLRIRGEVAPETAAAEYEALLAAEAARTGEAIFQHDVICLGMGEDGHTASLFPGLPVVEETKRLVMPAIGPKPPPQRVTMTLPLLNAARQVFFLVGGVAKAPVLRQVLAGDRAFPSARVLPAAGTVTWLLASDLAESIR